MYASLLTLSALLTTAFSIPVTSEQAGQVITTGLMAVRSASPIHLRAVNATGRGFWIGRPTTTFCPYDPPNQNCDYPNTTAIDVYTQPAEYQAYMFANVAGGQNVYVGPTGALLFTEAHEEYNFPKGSYTSGFHYIPDKNNVAFLTFTNGSATSWYACPNSKKTPTPYRVYANVKGFVNDAVPTGNTSDCLSFGMVATSPPGTLKNLTAWQYE